MRRISRRTAINETGVGVAAALAARGRPGSAAETPPAPVTRPRAIEVPGLHAYADTHGLDAGAALVLRVSSTVPYRLTIVRPGARIDDPTSDETLVEVGEFPGRPQPIRPGSFVVVEQGIPATVTALALECWVRPFRPAGEQIFFSQGPRAGGIGLGLTADGRVEAWGPVGLVGGNLAARRWHHVVVQWAAGKATLWIDAQEAATAAFEGGLAVPDGPLLLAASEVDAAAGRFLEGDLAMPAVHGRPLTAAEVADRFANRGTAVPSAQELVACWPLTEEHGDVIGDVGPRAAHGRIVNLATWMIGGPSFDAARVERYGDRYDPARDGTRGHGLRFAGDDLYDCGWEVSHTVAIPDTAQPGIHAARFVFESGGKPRVAWVTFVVRRRPGRPPPPLLVLCSTNTWLAYAATPFCVNQPAASFWPTYGHQLAHPAAPAYSCYRNHHAGQPTYQMGTRLPWPAAGPDVLYSKPQVGYSHLARGERFAHVWLEENGYDFDCATDFDLHRDPRLLDGYASVLINGHSEYWSSEALDTLDAYLRRGGTAVVLSGNTMFWRVSFNEAGTVMECRKLDERIGGRVDGATGELYHSHDGRRGSLLRECGRPAWRVVGLECDGWAGTEAADFGVYHVETPEHVLFQEPEPIGLAKDATFGHAVDGGLPRAVGHEWDVRVSRLVGITGRVPAGTDLPTEPPGIVTLARGVRAGRHALDYFTAGSASPDGTVADLIYWERPQGGKVFHAGAIGAGWALSADPTLQALMRNVLHHFGIPRPRRP
ncbi:MAG: LamG domain-containing protein [Planctomycetes bacterium]|nr:LamG domain-containing protein [Planctomycetota bacterium]